MKFHHVGCVVKSIDEYLSNCLAPLGLPAVSPVFEVSSQRVRVCFVRLSEQSLLELVEPIGSESSVEPIRKRGGGYYHLCFMVTNIERAIDDLSAQGFDCLDLFTSEAFEGRRCCFLFNPCGHLVELAESSPVG